MPQFVRRRRWLLPSIIILIVVGAAIVALTLYVQRREQVETYVETHPQAPPDLAKLRERFASGLDALHGDDGDEAVKQLASFDFGSRAVEQYRLYYLANGYQLAGNTTAVRATLATLWRRKPNMVYAADAAFNLAGLYEANDDWRHAANVYASLAANADQPSVAGTARWQHIEAAFAHGDPAAMLDAARATIVESPRAPQAAESIAVFRSLTSTTDDGPLKLTHHERLVRAEHLRRDGDAQSALEELDALAPAAPSSMKLELTLERGITLQAVRRYEESNKLLEPLAPGPYKYAIPALRTAARNYRILSDSIDPTVIKIVKERKQIGTIRVGVGKGKKRHFVKKPKYGIVPKQVKLVDLAKKKKKDEFDRLASERLKDVLSLRIDDAVRLEALNALCARAIVKNQDDYVRELVPQIIALDPSADPGLQFFWDKAWAAYARGDLNGAKPLFRFIADHYTHPNVRRQNDYWYARTIDRLGAKDEASAIYRRLASAPYDDLYAIHAESRAGNVRESAANPLDVERPDWEQLAEKEMPAELRLGYELIALQQPAVALPEIRRNARPQNRHYSESLLADYYNAMGSRVLAYRSLRVAWPQLATVEQDSVPKYFVRMYYPIRYEDDIEKYAKRNGLDPNLVMALILQESYFDPKARSRVGATGLMQLMPPTARELARRLNIAFADSRLENPAVNVELGTTHLKMLVNLFGGNTYLAVASYNAGQGNVAKWRRAAPKKPLDEFLESIPFPETRNYVKRVTMLRSSYERLRK